MLYEYIAAFINVKIYKNKNTFIFFYIQVYLHGYHGDCSKMFEVEECDDEAKRLINITELCLKNAIDICKPNENFSSIGNDYI